MVDPFWYDEAVFGTIGTHFIVNERVTKPKPWLKHFKNW